MLCSNCGFDNPSGHHFCGMCGTPLPQRPIIAPGAQSTADLTRRPVEVSQSVAPPSKNISSLSTATEPIETETQHSVSTGPNYFSQAEQAESLEQFIAGFRYAPPPEEEVTMTGAKPELDEAAKYEPPAPVSVSDEPPVWDAEPSPKVDAPSVSVAEPVPNTAEPLRPRLVERDVAPPTDTIIEQPPFIAPEPPPFATKGMRDQDAERSRFLDLSERPKEEVQTSTPTSIGGPSFLGLSDTPASMAYGAEDGAERQSHWRVWVAVIVVGVFAVLGFLEWRSERGQGGDGPIGIMKMQLDRLKGQKGAVITPPSPSQASPAIAEPAPSSSPNGPGPKMQVAPQPKPQTAAATPPPNRETVPAGQAKSGPASNPGAATPLTKAPPSPTQPSGAVNGAKSPEKASANAEPAPSSTKAATSSAETQKPAKPTTPGAEELAKAASASDAAAASAWLWKAVAKGNPEAPVKLANLYIKGDGVPQSCEQALVLLRSAAAQENAAALSRLGTLYATATCVPRNRVRAYQYMDEALAANPGAAWPRQFKEQLWAQMTPEERQRAQKAQ